MRKNKFNIGDRVYHITPESDMGVVLDAEYSLLNNRWLYRVTFSAVADALLYYEHELSETKIFV